MRKVLQIKEFDSITCKEVDKVEYGKYRIGQNDFEELMQFVREYTADNEHADALEFMRVGYKRNVGYIISFNNYVGMIQLPSGMQIEILPKIDFADEEGDSSRTKKIFLKMIRTMKDFDGKAFSNASLNIDRMNLYEIFINMYLQEVRNIVKKGIRSDYIGQEDNLKYYKGKMLVNNHMRNNIIHKERFFVAYDEFHPNRTENRLIKSTLLKLHRLTNSSENSKEIYRLLTFFEMVEPSKNYEKDFSGVKIDRNTKEYALIMQWSKVFLMNSSFSTFSGSQDATAILFPMESVYESFVARQLKNVMAPRGYIVSAQDKGHYLFEEPRKQFALRPDIVITNDERCIVLDTKWKELSDNYGYNYGISQSDMYQMYAYSKKYKTPEIWLLYPMTRDFRDHSDIWFGSDKGSTLTTNVRVYFVDLSDENCFEKLSEELVYESKIGNVWTGR